VIIGYWQIEDLFVENIGVAVAWVERDDVTHMFTSLAVERPLLFIRSLKYLWFPSAITTLFASIN
jgi:hypothetical protein